MFSRIKKYDLFLLLILSAIPAFYHLKEFRADYESFLKNIQITTEPSLQDGWLSLLFLFGFYLSLRSFIRIFLALATYYKLKHANIVITSLFLVLATPLFMTAWFGFTFRIAEVGFLVAIILIETLYLYTLALQEEYKIQEKEQTDFLKQFEPK